MKKRGKKDREKESAKRRIHTQKKELKNRIYFVYKIHLFENHENGDSSLILVECFESGVEEPI